jgi:hypothetical protein
MYIKQSIFLLFAIIVFTFIFGICIDGLLFAIFVSIFFGILALLGIGLGFALIKLGE